MRWICIKGTHINAHRVESFYWGAGTLRIWFAGNRTPLVWEDPDRELYVKMCHVLGVRPDEEDDAGGKN